MSVTRSIFAMSIVLACGAVAGPTTMSAGTPDATINALIAAGKANDVEAAVALTWKGDESSRRQRVERLVGGLSSGTIECRLVKAETHGDVAVATIDITEKGRAAVTETGGLVLADGKWKMVFDPARDGILEPQAKRLAELLAQARPATTGPSTHPAP